MPKVEEKVAKPKGTLRVRVIEAKTGKVIKEKKYQNLAVNGMKTQLSHLISSSSLDNRYVNRMKFGTGTTDPDVTDTDLESAITPVKTVASVSYPSVTSVAITATLDEDEANGFAITEAGLICADGTMVARRVFGALNKTADFIFSFEWTLSF